MIWNKRMTAGFAVAIACSLLAIACSEKSDGYADPRRTIDPEQVPETKRIRRVTADQFLASLEVATGQRWDDAEEFAATLGRPDFAEVTVEGREMSVGFAKLAGDAARETCRNAVQEDRSSEDPASRTILRWIDDVDALDPFTADVGENLRYLLLRFHGAYVTEDDDRRLQPWFTLLQDGRDATDPGRFAEGEDRWAAVCTGLALHPDFLTY